MQNVQVEEVDYHKHLGLYFSQDSSWYKHIDYIKVDMFVLFGHWFPPHICFPAGFVLALLMLGTAVLHCMLSCESHLIRTVI